MLAKPPVRKLARDSGVDLSGLADTGPNGSITRDDVLSAVRASWPTAAGSVPGTPPAAQPGPAHFRRTAPEERIPIRGVRKHTAAAVTASAFTAPHVTEFLQIDMTETMAAADRLKSLPDFAGVRVSPLLFVAKALLIAAARYPMINSSWDEDAQEIVVRHYVNLGIAAATERGLIVPNIKDAQALTLPALGRALNDLADTARAGKASPADLTGGTITITNVGVFGRRHGHSHPDARGGGHPGVRPACGMRPGCPRGSWRCARSPRWRCPSTTASSTATWVGRAQRRGAMLTDPLRMLAWG